MIPAGFLDEALLLERNVRDDDAVDAGLFAARHEFIDAVDEHRIDVGHEDERRIDFGAQFSHHLENIVGIDAVRQSPLIGFLDGRAFRNGIGERDADFDDVRSVRNDFPDDCFRGFQVWIPCSNERDECFMLKGCCDLIHGCQLPCILRLLQRPYRHGPTNK